jgi:hypothetical protein
VATYLVDVQSIIPYLDKADHFIGYDVEDKDE